MRKRVDIDSQEIGFLKWVFLVFAVAFYPLLASIYTMLPPLIGVVGLIIIYNMDRNVVYVLAAMLYLLNIELNFSLPVLLSIFSIIVIYVSVYPSAKLMIRCQTCLSLFLIIVVDAFYYMNLFIYDFIFSSSTVIGDSVLLFYIMLDLFLGFFL